mmetsp:Transcript_44498/g.80557  ORF Transcript_44498/g.80557 Transcript_44498/m.80557 type:complete len:228 (+) Transcript_44498:478-1161(+)
MGLVGQVPNIQRVAALHEEDARAAGGPGHRNAAAGRLGNSAAPVCDGYANGAVEDGQVAFRVSNQQETREEGIEGSTAGLSGESPHKREPILVLVRMSEQLQAVRAICGRGSTALAIGLAYTRCGYCHKLCLLLRVDAKVGGTEKATEAVHVLRERKAALQSQLDAGPQLEHSPEADNTHGVHGKNQGVAIRSVRAADAANLDVVQAATQVTTQQLHVLAAKVGVAP